MEQLYVVLDDKFRDILSGTCLTSLREENSRISKKYEAFEPDRLPQMREDFMLYISNMLFLKGYDKVDADPARCLVRVSKDGQEFEFLLDFDFGKNDGMFSIKVLDRGVKCGISVSDAKYIFIVSVDKGLLALLNCERLKNSVKAKDPGFRLLTETDSLFKTQYVNLDHAVIADKTRLFSLK